MAYVRLSPKEKQTAIALEQVFVGDFSIEEVRKILLQAETARDDAAMWFEAVVNGIAMGTRQLFVARYGKQVVGYMILKPQESKISSIYVVPAHRGKRAAEGLYGLGVVSLGTPYPYTVFVQDMIGEFKGMIKSNDLALDDTGPLCVLNPGDDVADQWSQPKPLIGARQIAPQRRTG